MNMATSPEMSAAMHCCDEPGYGDVRELEAGHGQEQFGGEMRRAAYSY